MAQARSRQPVNILHALLQRVSKSSAANLADPAKKRITSYRFHRRAAINAGLRHRRPGGIAALRDAVKIKRSVAICGRGDGRYVFRLRARGLATRVASR